MSVYESRAAAEVLLFDKIAKKNNGGNMEWVKRQFIGTRKTQQDSIEVGGTEKGLLIAVCDGMGSREKAAESSHYAAQTMVQGYLSLGPEDISEYLSEAAEQIDSDIYDQFGGDGGTTGVFIHLTGRELRWVSVGDSRLYIYRNNVLTPITHDHNYKYVLDNDLDEAANSFSAEKNQIESLVSYLGMGGLYLLDVSAGPLTLCENDVLLVTSDGLYKAIHDEGIHFVLSKHFAVNGVLCGNVSSAADDLINCVKVIDGRKVDNTSFVLIKI
ncbi:MAG: protein phosphatase 2C domain-containing protein [Ruminococcus sp.]|nr:protein phosphatase 2C domain-containing protein [Ruminococcus sp.]